MIERISLNSDESQLVGEDRVDFIATLRSAVDQVHDERESANSHNRLFDQAEWSKIMSAKPLSVAIPSEYGGRGVHVRECLQVLETASYRSLPLSLIFGINIALFLEPLARYGHEEVKKNIFSDFINKASLGGLMITEPLHGSAALQMQTSHKFCPEHIELRGNKHWQGLTGMADYWLIASREMKENGTLGRDICLTVCNQDQIEVTELYKTLGLQEIPYGINEIKANVPLNYHLTPTSTGLETLLDTLHRSRMQFPGMGMGFVRRMLDEATSYAYSRKIGNKLLAEFDETQQKLLRLQTIYTVNSAYCIRSVKSSSIAHSVATKGIEANTIKAELTELMQESAQILVQISGGNGYRTDNFGARGLADSRAFQIFEGPNDMLFSQIADNILKGMRKSKTDNFYDYLLQDALAKKSVPFFREQVNFNIDKNMDQRRRVIIGKVIAKIITAGFVTEAGEVGFDQKLVENTLQDIRSDVASHITRFDSIPCIKPVEEYRDHSDWSSTIST